LRIANQTDAVREKATSKRSVAWPSELSNWRLHSSPPMNVQHQARELFFLYYIADFSKNWTFLIPYFSPNVAPAYISACIDAVSLAFLAHQANSSEALLLSRQKYGAVLHKTNAALQCPKTARERATFEATLLLDLYEKITSLYVNYHEWNRAHIYGSLALVNKSESELTIHRIRDTIDMLCAKVCPYT
jgi:hypothetical protein